MLADLFDPDRNIRFVIKRREPPNSEAPPAHVAPLCEDLRADGYLSRKRQFEMADFFEEIGDFKVEALGKRSQNGVSLAADGCSSQNG